MNEVDTKYSWVLFIPLLLGLSLPSVIFEFHETERQSELWAGIFTSFAAIIYWLSNKMGTKFPKANEWVSKSLLGSGIFIFISCLVVSILCSLFASLPVPFWLHIIIGIAISIIALFMFMDIKN